MTRLRILALEPYYGGSHRAVLDGLVARIDAEWTVLTLPARKWKWRMRGAAMTMSAECRRLASQSTGDQPASQTAPFDVIFASTFLNLAEFRGMAGPAFSAVPALVYFHENQLVYPNRHTAEWDLQFPLTNITSALSAERCVFNSAWNRDVFVEAIPGFLREFPDHHPVGVAERIRAKSSVIAPPFDPASIDSHPVERGPVTRIVWPHRWEHDKNPDDFFAAVSSSCRRGPRLRGRCRGAGVPRRARAHPRGPADARKPARPPRSARHARCVCPASRFLGRGGVHRVQRVLRDRDGGGVIRGMLPARSRSAGVSGDLPAALSLWRRGPTHGAAP